jgi:hypothetical protein
MNNLQKSAPYRSKHFLKFCHESVPMTSCCLPGCSRPWSELHHWGDDGGLGMKPSDNEVARTCLQCHRDTPYKKRALIKGGYLEILIAFMADALRLNRLYLEHLEAKRRKK